MASHYAIAVLSAFVALLILGLAATRTPPASINIYIVTGTPKVITTTPHPVTNTPYVITATPDVTTAISPTPSPTFLAPIFQTATAGARNNPPIPTRE